MVKEWYWEILDGNIQDIDNNYTRFKLLSKKDKNLDLNVGYKNKKVSIVFSLKDKVGSLSELLNIFSKSNINLTKIESRPNNFNNNSFNYLFYVDFEGDLSNKNISISLFNDIRKYSSFFKIIGSFPKIQYNEDSYNRMKIGNFGRFVISKNG